MKAKSSFVLTIVLMVALIMACIPTSVYASIYRSGIELFSGYADMTEEDIFYSKEKVPADDLIKEIIELESALPSSNDKSAIVPHLVALIEKSDEFTSDELVNLIKDSKTDVALDSAFVKMLVNKVSDTTGLMSLLEDDSVAQETKEYIVALGAFSASEFAEIFKKNTDSVAIVAMKRITAMDENLAYELALPVLTASNEKVTSEQYIAACLGVAQYFENHAPLSAKDEDAYVKAKESVVTCIKKLYNTDSDELVKDQAIYALARMGDYDVFEYIINSEEIDFDLKVSTIERNIPLMIETISNASSVDEIKTVITAMQLHPIIDVGSALSDAISTGKIAKSVEITSLISYIETNGIKGVNKYE